MEENDELHAQIQELERDNIHLKEHQEELEHALRLKDDKVHSLQDELAAMAVQKQRSRSSVVASKLSGVHRKASLNLKKDNIEDLKALVEYYEAHFHDNDDVQEQLDKALEERIPGLNAQVAELTARLVNTDRLLSKEKALTENLQAELKEVRTSLATERQALKQIQDTDFDAVMGSTNLRDEMGTTASDGVLGTVSFATMRSPTSRSFYTVEGQRLLGHLNKRSPGGLFGLRQYQRRYLAVDKGKVSWWAQVQDHPDQAKCRGDLDLFINPCIIEMDTHDSEKFSLRPVEQVAVAGLVAGKSGCGTYTRKEFTHDDPTVRYVKDDIHRGVGGEGMGAGILFWLGRWYLGPDTNITHAVASREGPDSLQGLTAPGAWKCHKVGEKGSLTVTLLVAWKAGSFTGAHSGRILEFSTKGSEHTIEVWVGALNEHIEIGRQKRLTESTPTSPTRFSPGSGCRGCDSEGLGASVGLSLNSCTQSSTMYGD